MAHSLFHLANYLSSLIDNASWTNYFQNLNSLSEIDKSKINPLNDILADLEKENLSTALDYKVTNQEIFKAINKLKNGRASGLDLVLNEMLKAGQTTLIGCLNKLFNLIFTHSTYPKLWCEGYIIPIHKSGDIHNPENYRGIMPLILAHMLLFFCFVSPALIIPVLTTA